MINENVSQCQKKKKPGAISISGSVPNSDVFFLGSLPALPSSFLEIHSVDFCVTMVTPKQTNQPANRHELKHNLLGRGNYNNIEKTLFSKKKKKKKTLLPIRFRCMAGKEGHKEMLSISLSQHSRSSHNYKTQRPSPVNQAEQHSAGWKGHWSSAFWVPICVLSAAQSAVMNSSVTCTAWLQHRIACL